MHATCQKTADDPYLAQLQFQFFVTNCFNVSNVGSPQFPIRYSVQLPSNVNLRENDAANLLISNLEGNTLANALGNALPAAGLLQVTT